MSGQSNAVADASVGALARAVGAASDPQVLKIVAAVDAMIQRGAADFLIVPLRPRLAVLRPPHPLRFARLLFHPLDLLIVRAVRWRGGQQLIPRSAIKPMAEHVRLAMGSAATAIGREIAGRSTADVEVIRRVGGTLWPLASAILAEAAVPDGWGESGLGTAGYRPLADAVAAVLGEAVGLDGLRVDAAFGLVAAKPEAIAAMLGRVARVRGGALAMTIAVLLDRLPEAADLLCASRCGLPDGVIRGAADDAAELLLRRLEQQDGVGRSIAAGSLADAGAAAARIASLLRQLGLAAADDRRRERLGAARRHLAAACRARFAAGLQEQLLAPLAAGAVEPAALEVAARGLRVLETEARVVGDGATYDLLLSKATEAISAAAMRGRMGRGEQLRLVEILAGSDAAVAMLDQA